MIRHCIVAVVLTLALGTVASAQLLSTEVQPQVPLVGVPISVIVTDAVGTGFVINSSSCFGTPIHAGSPQGPIVYAPIYCSDDLLGVPPHGSFTINWNQVDDQGQQVPPGDYWMRLAPIGFEEWVCVSIREPGIGAHLRAPSSPRVGEDLALTLSAAASPGALYVVAASASTNVGIDLLQLGYFGLDVDLLFLLSFPDPNPDFFTGFQGSLDANGDADGLAVHVPNEPLLAHRGLHFQAAVLDLNGSLSFSNVLNLTVGAQPED